MTDDEPLELLAQPTALRVGAEALPTNWSEIETGLDKALRQRLTVAFLGSASSGKDAAIRTLFGVDFGEVDPIPGSTTELRAIELDADGQFVVVNAPGFQDVRSHVDEVARGVMDQLDVVVYLVNAEGGATLEIRRDLERVRGRGDGTWPTLVCINKIDLIREHQREEFVQGTAEQLSVPVSEIVSCAFDPLPQISESPIGIHGVISWIERKLRSRGKHLLFAKHLRDKRAACKPLIEDAARRAAVAGAIPIPGADITATTWLQVQLVEEIAMVHGKRLDKELVLFLVGELLAGTSKGFIRWALQSLKTAGWLPGARVTQMATAALGSAIAVGTTYGIGEAAIRYMQSNQKLDIEDMRAIFDDVASQASRQHLAGALEVS